MDFFFLFFFPFFYFFSFFFFFFCNSKKLPTSFQTCYKTFNNIRLEEAHVEEEASSSS